jgi:hypothetical protein
MKFHVTLQVELADNFPFMGLTGVPAEQHVKTWLANRYAEEERGTLGYRVLVGEIIKLGKCRGYDDKGQTCKAPATHRTGELIKVGEDWVPNTEQDVCFSHWLHWHDETPF